MGKSEFNQLDYNSFCDSVEKLLARNSAYTIITHSYGGGVGHKYISILSSIMVALSVRRQWTCM